MCVVLHFRLTLYFDYEELSNVLKLLGLNHEANIKKMRMLTFIQIIEEQMEFTFEILEKRLHLKPDEIEEFIIEGNYFRH